MPTVSRTRPELAALLLVASALVAAIACGREPAQPAHPRPRAIVLVTVDGLVPERLKLFGGAESLPELERLAAEGAAWSGWTAVPMTRPAAATYLTGLAPDRHEVRDDRFSALDASIPTLAEGLSAAGYETAAFPDSSFLGSSSGLLRGFDAVSDPRPPAIGPVAWLPAPRTANEVATDFDAWVRSLRPDTRWFAWLHFSGPLLGQLKELAGEAEQETEAAAESHLSRFDAALGAVRRSLDEHGDAGAALILIAGTQGGIRGGEGGAAGLGFSVGEPALSVPIVARWPGASGAWDEGRVAWAPDVPATISAASGVESAQQGEGLSLFETAPADRVCLAFSWATLDQMGWRAQRAARIGAAKRVEGLTTASLRVDGSVEPVPGEVDARLAEALGRRAAPLPAAVPLDVARSLLEARGVKLRPVPPEGRDFGDEAKRLEVTELVLRARQGIVRGAHEAVLADFAAALALDADNPAVRLDFSQILAGADPGRSRDLLEYAVARYPTDPELLHWYAHGVWQESWAEAESILKLIEPYKSDEADLLYDLACTRSLAADLEASEQYLRKAIAAGYRNFPHMETDPDLRHLRESGKLGAVVREHR